MTVGLIILLAAVVAGFLLDRRSERSLVARERHEWAVERASLLNRINPMTAQSLPDPDDGEQMPQPAADSQEWWDQFTDKFTEST